MEHVYEFWQPAYTTEHFLLPGEIARIWGLCSSSRKPHATLTSLILKEYTRRLDNYRPYFYMSKSYGMIEVYPNVVYSKALEWFLDKIDQKLNGSIEIYGRKYKYQFIKEEDSDV